MPHAAFTQPRQKASAYRVLSTRAYICMCTEYVRLSRLRAGGEVGPPESPPPHIM